VRLIDEDSENVTIEFAVTDTGIGIPKEKLATIFDNFNKPQAAPLGSMVEPDWFAAIVKQLVEPKGGIINGQ
jgi:signal transduction histidine kinase